MPLIRALTFLLFLLALTACQTPPKAPTPAPKAVVTQEIQSRLDLITEIKAYEVKLGWKPTDNFREYSDALISYRSCLLVPQLGFERTESTVSKEECMEAGKSSDVKHTEYEALAGRGTPLSQAMVKVDIVRFVYVVFHEDYHEQVQGIPSLALNESATHLAGLLAAKEFAKEKYGEGSELHRVFTRMIEDHLLNAQIQIRYYAELEQLFMNVRIGKLNADIALAQKVSLYGAMQEECKNIDLVVMLSCRNINDNASFSSSIPYAKFYPLFYDFHKACGGDAKSFGQAVIQLVVGAPRGYGEQDFAKLVARVMNDGCKIPS